MPMLAITAAALLFAQGPIEVGGHLVNSHRLLVKVSPGATHRQVQAAHALAGGRVVKYLPQIGWHIVEVAPGRLLRARRAYKRQAAIERADFDTARRLAYEPNDALWASMWHMRRIKANLAWDIGRGAPSVKIAIMDTGIEVDHPDLFANVWVNLGEVAGNGQDDDGNGYVDDVNGYDFAYDDPDPDDVYGHGTACAGLAAAVQDNGIGCTGVAPQCKLVAVKAAIDSGYFYASANLPALLYCADMGFKVISMSFFSDEVVAAEGDAINYCWSRGVLPVAAAGNDSSVLPYYPGAYENAIGVAATDRNDNKAGFSNWGTWVDVAAPGVELTTTATGSGYTNSFGGTSGATPHVAGLAGLLFGAAPSATIAQVRAAIEDTATSTIQQPFGEYTNYGLIDCFAALQRVLGQSSGSKPPRLLFCGPVAAPQTPTLRPVMSPTSYYRMTIYGVGFEPPNSVRILRNGTPLRLFNQTRNWVELTAIASGRLDVEVNGVIVGSIYNNVEPGWVYAASDASTKGGGTAVGGFIQLYRNDGDLFTCTRRSGGIYVDLAVRKVLQRTLSQIDLSFTRAYEDSVGGTETIEMYDWGTASYPYGSFVTVSSRLITGAAAETVTATIVDNPSRFLDYEGTMYFRVQTSAPGLNARMLADSFRVRVR